MLKLFRHFYKILWQLFWLLDKGGMKLDINAMSSTVLRPSLLEDIVLQYVIPDFCSAQYFVMFTIILDNSHVEWNGWKECSCWQCIGNCSTSELADTPSRQKSYKEHEIIWDTCFICQKTQLKNNKAL